MSRFAGLPTALKARAQEPTNPDCPEDDEDEAGSGQKSKKKDNPDMSEQNDAAAISAARDEGHAAGFKAATDRFQAVISSEHYAGREALAGKLLGKNAMSADDIVEALAEAPKVEAKTLTEEEQRAAAEEAGRKEMREQIQKGADNSSLDPNASRAADVPNHGWDAIHEDLRSRRG
jgi:hypothetical protein